MVYAISRKFVMKSVDRGDTWRRMVNGLDLRRNPSSISVAPSDPGILYLTSRGDGVYRSDDAGSTWTHVSETLENQQNLILSNVPPHSPDTVAAAAPTDKGRVWISTTAGEEWTEIGDIRQARSIAFAPDLPGVLIIGDQSGQIHLSANDGASWSVSTLDAGAITAVEVSPSFPPTERSTWARRTTESGRRPTEERPTPSRPTDSMTRRSSIS